MFGLKLAFKVKKYYFLCFNIITILIKMCGLVLPTADVEDLNAHLI